MDILTWLIIGVVAGGYTAYFLEARWDKHYIADILLGIIGALLGGGFMYFSGFGGPTILGMLNFYSIIIALMGSVIVISGSKYISGMEPTEEE